MKNTLSRRHFMQMATIGTGSLFLLPRCTNLANQSSWRFFTEKEASLVDAIIEQIIPTDEWLGAKEAGVTNFIDKQLVGPYIPFQERYKSALVAVDNSCEILYKKPFEDLSWNEQTNFLKRMEVGKLSDLQMDEMKGQSKNKIWEKGEERSFFNMIRNHTMQGFYGSPRHGGNKNYVSYKMIGLDNPYIVGQNRYKTKE